MNNTKNNFGTIGLGESDLPLEKLAIDLNSRDLESATDVVSPKQNNGNKPKRTTIVLLPSGVVENTISDSQATSRKESNQNSNR